MTECPDKPPRAPHWLLTQRSEEASVQKQMNSRHRRHFQSNIPRHQMH